MTRHADIPNERVDLDLVLHALERELSRFDADTAERRRSLETATAMIRERMRREVAPSRSSPALGEGRLRAPARAIAAGGRTVADRVEAILARSGGPLHVEVLLKELKAEKVKTSRKSLAKALNRWVTKGQRFRRPAPLTYECVE